MTTNDDDAPYVHRGRCEDYPCCGHERGTCATARLGLCDCGAKPAPGSSYCRACLRDLLNRDWDDW